MKRLPDHSSIFSAEAIAVSLALNIIEQSQDKQFLILSDSLSCLNSLENRNFHNSLVLEILESLDKLLKSGYSITFAWVPSHIGIAGNTAADATAKAALCLQESSSMVPYTDFKPVVGAYVNKLWQNTWNSESNNKLHAIQPTIKLFNPGRLSRRDEVLIHRLCVGHTYLTHSYLLHKDNPPECEHCKLPLTVEHILIHCLYHATVRQKFYNIASLEELFKYVNTHAIVSYIKEIGLYHKL